ncbi:MAG: serine/threonine-protein kinase [Anaerolineae bacterium]|nr:serine/threonine-protein kinase [Anaerolineae bacterium]
MLPPLPAGTILRQRYKITNIVGQGGMGSIYQAEDLRLPGRLCAVKEVQPEPGASPEVQDQAQQQFLQEASILARLDHPNLPKVSDFFQEEERAHLVMDYVPGKDLREVILDTWGRGKSLAEAQVLGWAGQIVDALDYLHTHDPPVLHRDIKPANLKLTPSNRIKLVDFGLVKLMNQDDARTITVVQGRGTVLYTPLEQYGDDSGHTDPRSDIYALGATLYHLLTGQAPPSAKARFLNPGRLHPPRQLNRQLSATVSDAVMWAMEMHPSQRPETARQLLQALEGQARRTVTQAQPQETELAAALRENRVLILATATLFILALLLTLM